MSNPQKPEKIWINGIYPREKEINGLFMMSLSIEVDKFIASIREHAIDGRISIDLFPRRESSDKGITHSASLNTWKPSAGSGGRKTANSSQPPQPEPSRPVGNQREVDTDGIPF